MLTENSPIDLASRRKFRLNGRIRRLCDRRKISGESPTARQIGIDPSAYMEWVLQRIVAHRANRGLTAGDLTPAAYKTTQQDSAQ